MISHGTRVSLVKFTPTTIVIQKLIFARMQEVVGGVRGGGLIGYKIPEYGQQSGLIYDAR